MRANANVNKKINIPRAWNQFGHFVIPSTSDHVAFVQHWNVTTW